MSLYVDVCISLCLYVYIFVAIFDFVFSARFRVFFSLSVYSKGVFSKYMSIYKWGYMCKYT